MPKLIAPALTSTANEIDHLRAFEHHKIELTDRGSEAVGTCPFCLKDGKLYVSTDTGQWQCKVCGKSGNPLTLLRELWAVSDAATNGASRTLAEERGLLDPLTVTAWGVCQSVVDGCWMVPGYDTKGNLTQLYRRVRMLKGSEWVNVLLPTPGVWPDGKTHALHMASGTYDPARPRVDIMEGPWDAMAFYEVALSSKWGTDGKLEPTGSMSSSILHDTNVVAVPGCNTFRDEWVEMCRGKDVTIWFDSDHPIVDSATNEPRRPWVRPGFDATFRNAKKLSGIAKSVRWLRWGKEGFDPEKKNGYDVRDHLRSNANRRVALEELYAKVEPAPADWFSAATNYHVGNGTTHAGAAPIEPIHCDNWQDCISSWRDPVRGEAALEWRQDIEDALAVMLAVCASTKQAGGNQLVFQLVAPPSSAKTTLCKGLLVSRTCHSLENLTGFFSGYKIPGEKDKDCSLIARINGKTLVTCEADVMVNNPMWPELMAEYRRIHDGAGGKTFKNMDTDLLHEGLRTPWILAGTEKLLDVDMSQVGDRFLRVKINTPTEKVKRDIMRRSFRNELSAMASTSNGTAASINNKLQARAQAITGGYVDWLRDNVEAKLATTVMPERSEDMCLDLGELIADMRARPNTDKRKVETHDTKELPARISAQLGRLAMCAAVALNKQEVSTDILRLVRKVTIDSADGHSLNVAKWLCRTTDSGKSHQEMMGVTPEQVKLWSGMANDRVEAYLAFMCKIGIVRREGPSRSGGWWKLTDRSADLCNRLEIKYA